MLNGININATHIIAVQIFLAYLSSFSNIVDVALIKSFKKQGILYSKNAIANTHNIIGIISTPISYNDMSLVDINQTPKTSEPAILQI